MGALLDIFWNSEPEESDEIPNEYKNNLEPSKYIRELEGLFMISDKIKVKKPKKSQVSKVSKPIDKNKDNKEIQKEIDER